MNDLEEMLTKNSPKPERQVSQNFTETVIAEIKSRPKQSRLHSMLCNLHLNSWNKASFALLAVVMVVGGTAAAISLWPRPTVTPTITQVLPSGNHIVGVDAENCQYFEALDGTATKPTSEKVYYEVRQDSKLTDQQIIDMVQGICEENVSNNAISATEKQLPKNAPGMLSTSAYTINAITADSITVTLDSHLDATLYSTKPNLTYTHFSDKLLIYNENSEVAYSDLKVGDTIKMIVQDTSGNSSETSGNYSALNHPENIKILAVVKIPALTARPDTFYKAIGKDIVRVEPCTTSLTGFCRVYDFDK